jgi:hypothetical protein
VNPELEALRARLMALEAGLSVAIGGPALQAIAGEAIALAGAIDAGIPPDDDWAVSRHGQLGSVTGPTSGLFAIFDGSVATSVRVISGERMLTVSIGDPTGAGSSLLTTAGLDLGALDPRRLASADTAPDEYGRRYIGAMRVTLIDGTEVVANEVIDEFGVGRPIAEIAMDELTERLEQGTARANEAAQDPGETENSSVGLPGESDQAGSVLRPTGGGFGGGADGLAAAAGTVTAVAASAAIRRLMRASKRPGEPAADTDAAPPPADQPTPAAADSVPCVFCAAPLTTTDRFCRGCGRPGPEARREVWAPTHVVPAGGLYAFERPDPSLTPSTTVEAGLPLQVQQTLGAWSLVVASNGWTGWVDGRFLEDAP